MSHPVNSPSSTQPAYLTEYDPKKHKRLRSRMHKFFVVMVAFAVIVVDLLAALLTQSWLPMVVLDWVGAAASVYFLVRSITNFMQARKDFMTEDAEQAKVHKVDLPIRQWWKEGERQPERASFWLHAEPISGSTEQDESDTLKVTVTSKGHEHYFQAIFLVAPTYFRTLYGPDLMDIFDSIKEMLTTSDAFGVANEIIATRLTEYWQRSSAEVHKEANKIIQLHSASTRGVIGDGEEFSDN